MTDEQIIKALERCFIVGSCSGCAGCPLKPKRQEDANCIDKLVTNTIDLIKRQQAEIDRLKKTNPLFEYAAKSVHQYIEDGQTYYLDFVNEEYEAEAISKKIDYLCHIQDVRAEAIKNFVMKLKIYILNPNKDFYVMLDEIDNLAKEMVGDSNA